MIHIFLNMFAKKLNSIKNLKDVKMADLPEFGVCSVKREIMHTSHTLCRLARIQQYACPDVAKMLNMSV